VSGQPAVFARVMHTGVPGVERSATSEVRAS
jgi:hypothetical protein